MNIPFDKFKKQEPPTLILYNYSGPLYSLGAAYDVKLTLRYGAINELSFRYPKSTSPNGEILPAYEELRAKKIIRVEGIGDFIVSEQPEISDGSVPIKNVTCQSAESELSYKRIVAFTGTYKLYDYENPKNTILGRVTKIASNWTIGYIDPDIIDMYRTFDVSNNTIYNFLTQDVSNTYGCIFVFNTISKSISAYAIKNINYDSGAYISTSNFAKEITLTEYPDELCTALYCYGGEGLDIRSVNPLGGNVLYNFDYFADPENGDWMSDDLREAIYEWENKVEAAKVPYKEIIYDRNQAVYELGLNQSLLYNSRNSLDAALIRLEGLVASGSATQEQLDGAKADIRNLRSKILDLNQKISENKETIENHNANLRKISNSLEFTSEGVWENFASDMDAISTSFGNLLTSWGAVYYDTADAITLNVSQLNEDYPKIVDAFSDAKNKIGNLKAWVSIFYANPYGITKSDSENLYKTIEDTIKSLNSLYDILSGLIPFTTITSEIASIKTKIISYSEIIYYTPNFTQEQYLALQSFIFENTYTNDNLIITDQFTEAEKIEEAQKLLEQGEEVIKRVSKPRFEISGNFINAFYNQETNDAIKNLDLGKIAKIELPSGQVVDAALLEASFSYEDPSAFNMVFSNRVKLNNSNFKLADMFIGLMTGSSGLGGITGGGGASSAATSNPQITGEAILNVSHALISKLGYISFGVTPPKTYGNNQGVWLGYDNAPKVSLYSSDNDYLQWDGQKLLVKARNFTLDSAGNITATNATLSGKIQAEIGDIGGWNINSFSLYSDSGNAVIRSDMPAITMGDMTNYMSGNGVFIGKNNDLYKFAIGNPYGDYFAFNGVNINAGGDWLAGWTFGEGFLYNGSGANRVTLSTLSGSPAFSAGNEDGNIAPFRVYSDGRLYSTNASISGCIIAQTGQIGGWKISEGELYSGSGVNRIGLKTDYSANNVAIYAGGEDPLYAKFSVTNEGQLLAQDASIRGNIYADTGAIGGWTISESSIFSGNYFEGTVGMNSSGSIALFAGVRIGETPELNKQFYVTPNGKLVASDAEIYGKIESKTGHIGNWEITGNGIIGNSIGLIPSTQEGSTIRIYAGGNSAENAPFRVNGAGQIFASSGNIAGWILSDFALVSPSETVGIISASTEDTYYPFYAGNVTPSLAPFNVDNNGKLTAQNAQISGNITAHSGSIANWRIAGNEIFTDTINLDSSSDRQTITVGLGESSIIIDGKAAGIRSSNYASNISGFNINGISGNAEFNNITARGEIKSAVFTYNEISATNGAIGVFKSSGVLRNDVSINPPDNFYINIANNKQEAYQYFNIGDIIRIKKTESDIWAKINSATLLYDNTTGIPYYQYYCTPQFGSSGTFTSGQTVVDYGASSGSLQGYLLMTAEGQYYSVNTHSGSPWLSQNSVVRIGNLNGFLGKQIDTFGIGIGTETGNHLIYDTESGILEIEGQINITGNSIVPWSSITETPSGLSVLGEPPESGTGLFVSSNYMGYYDAGEWDVYLDSNGIFQIGNSIAGNPYLKYTPLSGLSLYQTDISLFDNGGNAVIKISPSTNNLPYISVGEISTDYTSGSLSWNGSGIWMGKTLYGSYGFFMGDSSGPASNLSYNGTTGVITLRNTNLSFGQTTASPTMAIGTSGGMPFISMGETIPTAWNDGNNGIFMGRDPTTQFELLKYEYNSESGFILTDEGKIIVSTPKYVFRVGDYTGGAYLAWNGTSLIIQGAQAMSSNMASFTNLTSTSASFVNLYVSGSTNIKHSSLSGLSDDDHNQYLNTSRHDTTSRHTLGTVVPHDDHGLLSGLSDDDHTQYLNTSRHDTTSRHTLGTVVPHDDHGLLSGLSDDDHTQYLNNTRHDTATRHTLGTVVPHDDHGLLSGLGDDDHPKYTLAISSSVDNEVPRFDGTNGRAFQSSGMKVDDSGNVSTAAGNQPAGPSSTTDNAIVRYDGTDGKKIQNSEVTVDDSNNMTFPSSASLTLKSYKVGEWQSWTPTMTGWSSSTVNAQYAVVGKICFFIIYMSAGTSNSTTSQISLPIQASSALGKSGTIGWAMNNGTEITTACRWAISGAASVIDLYTNMGSGAWTASGTKRVILEGFYEI